VGVRKEPTELRASLQLGDGVWRKVWNRREFDGYVLSTFPQHYLVKQAVPICKFVRPCPRDRYPQRLEGITKCLGGISPKLSTIMTSDVPNFSSEQMKGHYLRVARSSIWELGALESSLDKSRTL